MSRSLPTPSEPSPYHGADRRQRPAADHRALVWWSLGIALAPAIAEVLAPRRPDEAATLATAALTLGVLVGLLACVTRRAVGDQRLLTVGAALVALGIGPVFVAGLLPADAFLVDQSLPNALLAALPPLVLLALAPLWPAIDTRARVWCRAVVVVAVSVGAAMLLTRPALRRLVDGPGRSGPRWLSAPGLAALALLSASTAVAYLLRARREDNELMGTLALVPLAGAVSAAFAATGVSHAAFAAWLTMCAGLLGALHGVIRAVLQAHRNERRRVLAALARVQTLEATHELAQLTRSQVHDLRSGLVMLEGAVAQLAQAPTDGELASAIVAEVTRLRAQLEPRRSDDRVVDGSYVIGEAIAPVLTCARAAGMTVSDVIDEGARVPGDPAVAAQVVHGLLANARRHAPGSPVEVACEVEGDDVVVRVADRGPGLRDEVRERLFQPGVKAAAGGGEGLGLAHGRRLAESQRGNLDVVERQDGVTFELRLPALPALGG